MNKIIGIVDYDAGNLLSIKRAIEQFNVRTCIIKKPEEMGGFDALVLPGVGAFKDGMKNLNERGFIEGIKQYAAANRPVLGICLGMQLLFESSEEFGYCSGLGLLAGNVTRLPEGMGSLHAQRVPHVGWSSLHTNYPALFEGLPEKVEYYFCHSYAVNPKYKEQIIANYSFGKDLITAAVKRGSIYGFQFHPEKSGKAGLQLIEKFLHEIEVI